MSQVLQARRTQCEHQNEDLLVWTSHRVMKWIKDIDLKVRQHKKDSILKTKWSERVKQTH